MWFAMLAGVALKSTLVLGAAWMAAFLLRGRSAAARHLVWTAAAAAVLALPFLSVSLPGLPVRAAGALLPNAGVVFQATARPAAKPSVMGTSRPAGAPVPAEAASWRPDWPLWLMLLWTAGAAALLAQMLIACCRDAARATLGHAHRRTATLALELAGGLGIRHTVDVLETSPEHADDLRHPAPGRLHALPTLRDGATTLRRIVLLHELAHVRRGDVATQMLARLALILNWWNPLAWMAWREFLTERERATDDMVLDAGARASDYAAHLLEVARSRQPAPALAWAAVAMARRSQLEARLTAILDSRVKRKAVGRASALAASLAAIALVAPLAAVRGQEKAAAGARGPIVRPQKVADPIAPGHRQYDHAAAGTGRCPSRGSLGQPERGLRRRPAQDCRTGTEASSVERGRSILHQGRGGAGRPAGSSARPDVPGNP